MGMLNFVDQSKCTANLGACYNYCEDTCFRSFRFEIDPANTENYALKVCSRRNPKMCIQVKGYQKKEDIKEFITESIIHNEKTDLKFKNSKLK